MQATIIAARDRQPSKVRVVLATAWLIASLAIGAFMGTQSGPEEPALSTISAATQP